MIMTMLVVMTMNIIIVSIIIFINLITIFITMTVIATILITQRKTRTAIRCQFGVAAIWLGTTNPRVRRQEKP